MEQTGHSQSVRTDSGTTKAEASGSVAPSIPDHQLLRCIGRGSYGEVWLAKNSLGAYRAVKVVYRKSFSEERPFEREWSGIRTFEPVSRSHEGFIDVLHVGMNEAAGCFYYIMELGDDPKTGQTIDPETYTPKTLSREIAANGKLSFDDCLRLGLALSQALAELHKRGLVHRDIKPSNIIFVNGVPKLADIGLVAEVNEARSYVGTEGFIPPEGPGTPQADVYGLGKVLYEASTGKDRQDFPELPTFVYEFEHREKFLELNEVILRACRPDCAERYPTAWEMHADLLVLANGKSVKRLHALERRLAAIKRAVSVVGVAALAVAVVGYQIYRSWRSAFEERQKKVGASVAYGMRSVDSGDLLGSLSFFAEALRLEQGDREREMTHRLRFGSTLAQCPKLVQFWPSSSPERYPADAEFSPDGKRVAVVDYDGDAQVYDLQTGKPCSPRLTGTNGLTSICFSPDSKLLAASSHQGFICLWDATSFQELPRIVVHKELHSLRFSPDSLRLVSGGDHGFIGVWSTVTREKQLELMHGTAQVEFVGYDHKGDLLVSTSDNGTAQLWNAANGKPVGRPLSHGSWVVYAAFSPDDSNLATACLDRKARVWDVASCTQILPDMNHIDGVCSVNYSPDGRMILTGCWDGTARLWRADDFQPVAINHTFWHSDRVRHAAWNNDGSMILTCCMDHALRIWDLAGRVCFPTPVEGHVCQDGSHVVVTVTNALLVRETVSGRQVGQTIQPQGVIEKSELSPDGQFLVSVSLQMAGTLTNRFVSVWDTKTGALAGPSLCFSNAIDGLVLSLDGQRLAVSISNLIQVWAPKTGTPVTPVLSNAVPVSLAEFSPDGARLATAAGANAQVWDIQSGSRPSKTLQHTKPVHTLMFSPDGLLLATGCQDPTLDPCYACIWDAATGSPRTPELPHKDGVLALAFSPDGRRVLTASEDRSVIEWDTQTGQQLLPPLQHQDQVFGVTFDSEGKWLATAARDGISRVWESDRGEALTPPLRQFLAIHNVRFVGDKFHLVTEDREGFVNQWSLESDARPAADLVALAQLLSSGAFYDGSTPRKKAESPEAVWQRLRGQYPSQFSVSREDLARWHDLEAQQSHSEAQRSELQAQHARLATLDAAEIFHLEYLLNLRPGDPSVRERLKLCKEALKANTGKLASGTTPSPNHPSN